MNLSSSKYVDVICIVAIVLCLALTVAFIFGESLGLEAATPTMGYEKTIFDSSYVHKVDIVMDDWDSFIANCENEEYANCTVVIDGKKHANVAIRAKGNTSLSTVSSLGSQRYSFKLEFDHYEKGKSLDGLDKLCLNNLIQDNTMMKDYLVYQMMDEFGVDAPLSSYVYITVNGEDWGLYLAVEGIEDSFLRRNYGSETGDLYKPDTLNFGAGRGNGKGFNMDDFDFSSIDTSITSSDSSSETSSRSIPTGRSSKESDSSSGDTSRMNAFPMAAMMGGNFPQAFGNTDGSMPAAPDGDMDFSSFSGGGMMNMFSGMGSSDVKLQYIDDDPDSYSNIFSSAKTDVTAADQKRLIAALKNLTAYEDLENTLDMDEVLRYFVIHIFVSNGDSYTGSMIHNYYLHEKDGLLSMIPWDYNLAYGTFQGGNASSTVNGSIDNPVSGGSDDRPMVGWIFSSEEYTELYHEVFQEFLDEWITNGRLEEKVTKTYEMLKPYVEKDPTKFCTEEEFEEGVSVLQSFLSLRGEAVEKQLAGDNTTVQCGNLNLSAMGSMGGSMGGGMGGGHNRSTSSDSSDNSQDATTIPTMPVDMNGSVQSGTSFNPQDMSSFNLQQGMPDSSQFGSGFSPQDMSAFNPQDMSSFNLQQGMPGSSQFGSGFSPQDMSAFNPQDMSSFNPQQGMPGSSQSGTGFTPQDMSSFNPQQMMNGGSQTAANSIFQQETNSNAQAQSSSTTQSRRDSSTRPDSSSFSRGTDSANSAATSFTSGTDMSSFLSQGTIPSGFSPSSFSSGSFPDFSGTKVASTTENWMWVGISALTLLLALVVMWFKRK